MDREAACATLGMRLVATMIFVPPPGAADATELAQKNDALKEVLAHE